jgi:hypothetical protein
VLSTEKVSVCNLAVAFLCIGFLEGNLALVFLTTRGLLRPSGSGICSSRISLTSQVKKREILQLEAAEIWEQLDEQYSACQ